MSIKEKLLSVKKSAADSFGRTFDDVSSSISEKTKEGKDKLSEALDNISKVTPEDYAAAFVRGQDKILAIKKELVHLKNEVKVEFTDVDEELIVADIEHVKAGDVIYYGLPNKTIDWYVVKTINIPTGTVVDINGKERLFETNNSYTRS